MFERWIPTKKRLPSVKDCLNYDEKTNQHYAPFWVTFKATEWGESSVMKLCYRPEINLWYRDGYDMKPVDFIIVAWKPYKKQRPYIEMM